MRALFKRLNERIASGEDAVLVSVIADSGSVPRGAGARMLITSRGRECGTIGGGAVELEGIRRAQEALREKRSHIAHYHLNSEGIRNLGMACGGDVRVGFVFVPAYDATMTALTNHVEELYKDAQPSWLITDENGAMGIYSKKSGMFGLHVPDDVLARLCDRPVQAESGGVTFYCESLIRAGTVYIFGGGHVSQALVPALAAVDFRCAVLEDRPEFCRAELFPDADAALLIDTARISDAVTVIAVDYIVIVTRGHKDDLLVLTQALRTPARYIGMIGSENKIERVFAALREQGFTDGDIRRVTAPVGLAIRSETPAEIAVSIAAQLILFRAGGGVQL